MSKDAPKARATVVGVSAAALVVLLVSVTALMIQSCGGSASDKGSKPSPTSHPVT
jgi:hypothetical protein